MTKNVIFEWARFNRQVQHKDEWAEQCFAVLYNLVNMGTRNQN